MHTSRLTRAPGGSVLVQKIFAPSPALQANSKLHSSKFVRGKRAAKRIVSTADQKGKGSEAGREGTAMAHHFRNRQHGRPKYIEAMRTFLLQVEQSLYSFSEAEVTGSGSGSGSGAGVGVGGAGLSRRQAAASAERCWAMVSTNLVMLPSEESGTLITA
jgi:hypothetical protein